MSLEKQWRMVNLLVAETEKGSLEWKSGVLDNSFQLRFGDNSLVLERHTRSQDDEFDYVIRIFNGDGDVAEEFSDNDLRDEFKNQMYIPEIPPYRVMGNLYEAARRCAFGSDKILDDILMRLGEIPF